MSTPFLSVVVPVFNEQDNVAPLVGEIVAALRGNPLLADAASGSRGFEIVYVDDHSRDGTLAKLQQLKREVPELRVVHHVTQSGQSTAVRNGVKAARGQWIATLDGEFEIVYVDDNSRDATLSTLQQLKAQVPELRVIRHVTQSGQSTAVRNGVKAARGEWIATLDGDGQNDPADIPNLLAERQRSPGDVKLFAGWRVQRQDTGSKRWASKLANAIRSRMLRDATPDTGCGIKLFERAAFLELPYFNHMHRYLPALMQRAGWKTVSVPVNHRARSSGVSKYTNINRALVGIADLRGVAWLIRRAKVTAVEELP